MATNMNGKGQVIVVAKQLIAGTAKHLSSATPVAFAGGSFTGDQITSKLQALVDLRSSVDAAKATAQAKLAAEAAQAPALRTFTRQLRVFVKASFSTSPDVLADFGITSKARELPTVEGKAAAVAKRAATRAARHTMGAKQKAGVKGDVTGVVVTPTSASATTVAAPSSPTTPATSAGPTAASSPTAPATSVGSTAAPTPHTA
jgi:hypothetical protein